MILIDFRENHSKVPQLLHEFKLPIQTTDLPIDYMIGKECSIERKTINDFITSIIDGRLFKQIDYLARNCTSPLLLLEGGGLYHQQRMTANAIRGVLLWITMKKKVPFIRTYNEYDTACMLRLLAKQYDNSEATPVQTTHRKKKKISLRHQQIAILTQIPGIGRQTAKDLLNHYGTIANVVQKDDAELLTLPHIGKERLASLRQLFPQSLKSSG